MGKGRIIVFAMLALVAAAAYIALKPPSEPSRTTVAREPDSTKSRPAGSGTSAVHTRDVAARRGSSTRPRPRADPLYGAELARLPLSANMPKLLERASADPPFAYSLAMALQSCAAAESARDTLLEDLPHDLPDSEKEKAVQALVELSAPCADLPANANELRYDLVNSAAEAGVLEAQIHYRALAAPFVASEGALARNGVMDEYRRKSVEHAREAARSGEPGALFNAYDVISSGLFGQPDPVMAYAYLNAYHLARPTKRSALLLDASKKSLTTQQLTQAEALRSSLISTH